MFSSSQRRLPGPGDRHDERPPAEQPGERELGGAHVLLRGQLLQTLDEREVAVDVLGLKARHAAPEVGRAESSRIGDRARQEAAAERAVGDEPDAELGAEVEQRVLRVAGPERVLGLQRRHRVRRVRADDRRRRRFADAEMADLALGDQPRHGAHRVLDGHGRIDAVDVVEIDHLDLEPPQAGLACLDDVLGTAIGRRRATRRTDIAELGGEHDLIAPSLDGPADELLVHAVPVDVGGVDQVDPALERAVQARDHGIGARLAVDGRAEADGGHLEPTQAATLHRALERGKGPICFVGALDSRLNVARSRSPGLSYPLASPPAAARPP